MIIEPTAIKSQPYLGELPTSCIFVCLVNCPSLDIHHLFLCFPAFLAATSPASLAFAITIMYASATLVLSRKYTVVFPGHRFVVENDIVNMAHIHLNAAHARLRPWVASAITYFWRDLNRFRGLSHAQICRVVAKSCWGCVLVILLGIISLVVIRCVFEVFLSFIYHCQWNSSSCRLCMQQSSSTHYLSFT